MEILILFVVLVLGYAILVNVGMATVRALLRLPQGRDGLFFAHRF